MVDFGRILQRVSRPRRTIEGVAGFLQLARREAQDVLVRSRGPVSGARLVEPPVGEGDECARGRDERNRESPALQPAAFLRIAAHCRNSPASMGRAMK